jgi:hypothetical protein
MSISTWIPKRVGRWAVQANRNTSSYVRSDVLSFRHSRTLVPKYVTMSVYYRLVDYLYANRSDGSPVSARTSQRYYGADISVNFARSFSFMVLGELATIVDEQQLPVEHDLGETIR